LWDGYDAAKDRILAECGDVGDFGLVVFRLSENRI